MWCISCILGMHSLAVGLLRLLDRLDHAATDLACLLEPGRKEVCVVSSFLSFGDRLGVLVASAPIALLEFGVGSF